MAIRFPATIRFMVGVWLVASAMPATAQTQPAPDSYAPEPAHLAYLDGAATLEHDGRAETATANIPIVGGDRLRTGEGRAEVIFGDGSVLDVDHFTSVDFQSDQLLRLMDGRLRLAIGGRDRVSFRIDTPSSSVRIESPGEYRVSLLGDGHKVDVELVTYRGYAALVNDNGETTVPAGQRAYATASLAPSYAEAYNSAVLDGFDEWAADRRDERTGTTSARYVPDDVRGYSGVLDRYGDWQYDVSYGYVWYPRVVVGWRPYSYGRWDYYGRFGWTWIAYDPWGWPTHHYGRWGYNAGLWFWIPAAHWGPAWVYWGSGPSYVGWCPLGWRGGPAIGLNVYSGSHGWHSAWTMVPRHQFGSHGDVGRFAVRTDNDHAVPRGFVANGATPDRPAGAFVRASAPIYSAGRADYAVRRGGNAAPSSSAPANSFTRPGQSDQGARAYRRAPDGGEMPRSSVPASPGSLGQARTRSGDAGAGGAGYVPRTGPQPSTTGGFEPRTGGYEPRTGGYAPRTGGYEPRTAPLPSTTAPGSGARRRDSGDLGPGGPVYTPPQREGSPRYAPPSYGAPDTMRSPGGYERGAPAASGNERATPRGESPRYSPPSYRAPDSPRPAGGYERRSPDSAPGSGYERAAPRGGDSPRYSPPPSRGPEPRAPSGGYERSAPQRQAPPSAGGGAPSRGGERAAPRGGGGGGGGGNSGGGGGHQRRPG